MEYRNLGRSGLVVSAVGLGCNNFGRPKSATETKAGTDAVVGAAIDAGVTLFDTADTYGAVRGLSEQLMGDAFKGRRDQVVLATKFGHRMDGANGPEWEARASRRYVRRAIEGSLRRLQTDWIDLYQLHMPDGLTPIEETLSVLEDLVTEGKVRYIGHSNLQAWQIADAEYQAILGNHPRFISAQNEYLLLARGAESEILPAVIHYKLGFLPYLPLYNGLLTGRFTRTGGPADSRIVASRPRVLDSVPWDAMDRYEAFCAGHDVTMLEATIAWLLARPGITSVIAGVTKPEQLAQNAKAASGWSPTELELAEISAIFASRD